MKKQFFGSKVVFNAKLHRRDGQEKMDEGATVGPGQHFRGDSPILNISRTFCAPPPPPPPSPEQTFWAATWRSTPGRMQFDEN